MASASLVAGRAGRVRPGAAPASAAFVLGSGRCGTSAVTRVVNLLGVDVAHEQHRPPPDEANRRGYWECQPLSTLNERLLSAFGGLWIAPPNLEPGWERDVRLAGLRREARAVLARVHGTRQWVWKDPRTSLTLPFWLDVADVEPAVVLIYRHPLEVADSLAARDGLPDAVSLAIWERLNRAALTSATGLPTFVVRYRRLVSEPGTVAAELKDFLLEQGFDVHDAAHDVESFVDPSLRRSRAAESGTDEYVSESQLRLLGMLDALAGAHEVFAPPDLTPETPWVEPLHDARRRVLALERELHRLAAVEERLARRTWFGLHLRVSDGSHAR